MSNWNEIIVDAPYGKLSKRDVYEHYKRVKNKIFEELLNKPILIRQSFTPENIVLRRKDPQGNLLYLTPETYNRLTEKRLTEIHRVFGDKTDEAVVDIDPGRNVSWEEIKETAKKVREQLKDLYGKDPQLQFSGGRGFYVKVKLDKPQNIAQIREQLKEKLRTIAHDRLVMYPPQEKQIRLDLAPMKSGGSYRAPYSIATHTGLVSKPVNWKDLPKIEKEDFMVKQNEFFAPGIPAGRAINPIPKVQNKNWLLAIQEHKAERAGKHWDVRFVDPETQQAHSFAMRKTKLPRKNIQLAVQQPTHTADYATTFSGTIPEGYGAGKVKLKEVTPITVVSAHPNAIKFVRNNKLYVLFRMEGNKWGFRSI